MRFDRKSVQIINAGTPKVAFSTCTQALSTDSQYHTLAASGAIHKDYGSFRVQGSTGGIQHTKARGFGILTDSFANEGFNKETHRLLHVEGSCGTTNTDLVPVLSVGFMDPTTSDTSVATGVKSTFGQIIGSYARDNRSASWDQIIALQTPDATGSVDLNARQIVIGMSIVNINPSSTRTGVAVATLSFHWLDRYVPVSGVRQR